VNRLTHLLDNSVYVRIRYPSVRAVLEPLQSQGRIGRCGVLHLEAMISSLDPAAEHRSLTAIFPLVDTHQADWERAEDVMLQLAAAGKHRSVPWPDALLAAVAERSGLTVLHYDRDFETIAGVTGQPVQAVAPLGSL
jgi:predicted nucleic acid-binding protein